MKYVCVKLYFQLPEIAHRKGKDNVMDKVNESFVNI